MKGCKFTTNAKANHLDVCNRASNAFDLFFKQLIASYSVGAFMSVGTVVVGNISTPLAGQIAGFSPATWISRLSPNSISSKFKDKSKPFWVNFYSCFDDIFKTSSINIDCKTGGFVTPYMVNISMLDYTACAIAFTNTLKSKRISNHKDFLRELNSAINTLFTTSVNSVVNYSGAGAGTYTSTVTITFAT